MISNILKTRELVLIAGCGDVGASLASTLSEEGKRVVLIDIAAKAFDKLKSRHHIVKMEADASDIDVLEQCDIAHAGIVLAVTDNDNTNIFIAEIASMLYNILRVIIKTRATDKKDWLLQDYKITTIGSHTALIHEFEKECATAR